MCSVRFVTYVSGRSQQKRTFPRISSHRLRCGFSVVVGFAQSSNVSPAELSEVSLLGWPPDFLGDRRTQVLVSLKHSHFSHFSKSNWWSSVITFSRTSADSCRRLQKSAAFVLIRRMRRQEI